MRVCPSCRSTYTGQYQFCGIDGKQLVDQSDDPLIGQLLGRYRIEALLGQGASGSVYRAKHTVLESPVAIKVLFGDLGADQRLVGRFKREAQAAGKVRNPHVVSMFDFGTTPTGLTYLSMELVEGRTLHQVLAEQGALTPIRAARIAAQIAEGLAAVHASGLVHRDVKPANIVVLEDNGEDFVKLLDFGIVRITETPDATKLTGMGLVVGTPGYMAPEQCCSSDVTSSADLYALGVVLFEMLSGEKPFRADSLTAMMIDHVEKTPDRLQAAGGLEHLVARLLQKSPKDRPESAQAVIVAIEAAEHRLKGEDLGARDSSADATAPIDEKRAAIPRTTRKWVIGLSTLILLIIAALGLLMTRPNVQTTSTEKTVQASAADLKSVLQKRGLTLSDLAQTEDALTLIDRWQEADGAKNQDLAQRSLQDLIKIAETAPISKELLRKKLARLDSTVAGLKEQLDPDRFGALESRYGELYRRVSESQSDEDRAWLSRTIRTFEEEVERIARKP